jgi:hypothetical protein
MCDYSLHHIASTPAKVGDRLVTMAFASACTRGFSAIGRPDVAVCLRPGTELSFDDDVETLFGSLPRWLIALVTRQKPERRLARFRQIDMDRPRVHHDALEFPDGRILLVTYLRPGQRATVLQLPAAPKEESHALLEPARELDRA